MMGLNLVHDLGTAQAPPPPPPAKAQLMAIFRDFTAYNVAEGHPDFESFLGTMFGCVADTLNADSKPTLSDKDCCRV